MPVLKIDGREVEVPRGRKVIEAAEQLGIIVPRFCYHPALGSVGACRMCAVTFLEGPIKGVEMSCMVDAEDGMVVSTTDEHAFNFRRSVIEWLMMNHPHDCPVCDEGGHCLLQDMTVSGGHGIRRFPGKKRTYHDQDLGVFIQHEMNRCIHCWRCRRFYQEFAGYRDLGAMQIGRRTYFGRFSNGPLESPFAGNLSDICPTGVFTDKPSRYTGRRWDFERHPSLCLHCSLVCQVVASARYRKMARLEARFSRSVNGHFICDRGRYGFYYTSHPERPRRSKLGPEEVPWDQAIFAASKRLAEIGEAKGPRAIACQGSSRNSLETQGMLKQLSQVQGWQEARYFLTPSVARAVKEAVARLDRRVAVSMREIEGSDFVLTIGADPLNEAPMLAMAIRQAYRQGAKVVAIDPRPIDLPFVFEHLSSTLDDMELCLSVLVKGAVERSAAEKLGPQALRFYNEIPAGYHPDPSLKSRLRLLTQRLKQSQRPVIVCGTDIVRETTPSVAADGVLLLQAMEQEAGLFFVFPGANAFGASLLSSSEASLTETVEAIENGAIKGLVLVEVDPFRMFHDQRRMMDAFKRLDLLLVMDYLPSQSVLHADIFLPTQTLFEAGGTFVNQEGRAQFAPQVHGGGMSIEQVGGGGHPPRSFRNDIPGGEPEPAWRVLEEIGKALSPGEKFTLEGLWSAMADKDTVFSSLVDLVKQPDGVRLVPQQSGGPPFSLDRSKGTEERPPSKHSIELLLVDWTFGTEELSAYSPLIQQVETIPSLLMHRDDAEKLGLTQGDRVVLGLDGGSLETDVRLTEDMVSGIMILPRHRQLTWQKLKRLPMRVPVEQIKKA